MNTNTILDGFNAMLKQLIASAVADAIKPLQDRILAEGYMDWKGVEHVAAKAMQPLQDRIVAVEINQSMGKAVFTLPDVDFNEAVRNVLDGYNFINRNEVVDLVEEAIGNHDFSDIDISGAIEEGIENYDFSDIIEENMPGIVQDRVQEMIDEALDNCTIRRG